MDNDDDDACAGKYAVGELILCYEPDPKKAKMLYDAKIIDADATKDESGRRVSEYYVHFQGWNKSWDRWVLEDQIHKNDEEGRALQGQLYNKAIRRRKSNKKTTNAESEEEEKHDTCSLSSGCSNDETKAIHLPVVSLDIPKHLAMKLEDDCYNIKRRKLLIRLPRSPCVTDILNQYYAHCETCSSTPEGRHLNLQITQEMIEGLHTYFNFMLHSLLLYNFERDQYCKIFSTSQSHNKSASRTGPDTRSSGFQKEAAGKEAGRHSTTSFVTNLDSVRPPTTLPMPSDELESSATPPIQSMPRETRSASKKASPDVHARVRSVVEVVVPFVPVEKELLVGDVSSESKQEATTPGSARRRSSRKRCCSGRLKFADGVDAASSLPSTAVSLEKSKGAATHISTTPLLIKAEEFPADIKPTESDRSFMPLPQTENGRTPADIYGPEHFLRLFVKLPVLLASASMDEQKLGALLENVSHLLMYMADRLDIFSDTVYSEPVL